MLNAIRMIQLGPSAKLTSALGKQGFTRRLQGYVKGCRVVAERDLAGGRMEVELELPLTGPGGLTSLLHDR
jgi:hypothetical protein